MRFCLWTAILVSAFLACNLSSQPIPPENDLTVGSDAGSSRDSALANATADAAEHPPPDEDASVLDASMDAASDALVDAPNDGG